MSALSSHLKVPAAFGDPERSWYGHEIQQQTPMLAEIPFRVSPLMSPNRLLFLSSVNE